MGYAVDCPTYKDLVAKIPDSPEYKKISAQYKVCVRLDVRMVFLLVVAVGALLSSPSLHVPLVLFVLSTLPSLPPPYSFHTYTRSLYLSHQDFFVQLQNWTGEAKVNLSNVWKIADVVYVQFVHNLSSYMPWATPEVRQVLANLSIYDMKWLFDSVEKSRLACGEHCVCVRACVCLCVCVCVCVSVCVCV